jgi:hypothetical protein
LALFSRPNALADRLFHGAFRYEFPVPCRFAEALSLIMACSHWSRHNDVRLTMVPLFRHHDARSNSVLLRVLLASE